MKTRINLIENVAPTLAAALEGPFAGVASKFIIEKLAVDHDSETRSTDDILDELLNSTENLKKIKVLDEQFKLEMKELNVDVYALKTVNKTKR